MTDALPTIALACDHAGFDLKQTLKAVLVDQGYPVLDLGTDGPASVDYPDYGHALAAALEDGRAQRGLAICGSGIGIAIACNRHKAVRAAQVHDVTTARLSRSHNDANVLALGARLIGEDLAKECLATFLATAYEGGRHDRRVAKL